MKMISEKDVTTFNKWWKQNKAVYEALEIKRNVAATIWSAAIDSFKDAMMKQVNKYGI